MREKTGRFNPFQYKQSRLPAMKTRIVGMSRGGQPSGVFLVRAGGPGLRKESAAKLKEREASILQTQCHSQVEERLSQLLCRTQTVTSNPTKPFLKKSPENPEKEEAGKKCGYRGSTQTQ